MDQIRIPCVIMRGGTSKGIFLKENDLPKDQELRDKYILAIFGSPDIREIDGLAGAEPLTSKLAIIGPPTVEGADVDYTFGQVSIDSPVIDYNANCGNISSAVGPFAIEESMVTVTEPVTCVRIHNTNTHKILKSYVQVKDGKPRVTGDFEIAGVPGTAAPIELDFSGTAGAYSGKTLPTGNPVDVIQTSKGPIEASIVDVANPSVFVRAKDIGMKGTETPQEIDSNLELLAILEEIRGHVCIMLGMCNTLEEATKYCPAVPLICAISEAQDYVDFTTGKTIHKEDVDFLSRMMFMQITHKAYAGTGTACTGAAAKLKGTLVYQQIPNIDDITTIRIGHPSGVIPVSAEAKDGIVEKAAYIRTARRIMEGYVYIEKAKLGIKED